MTTSIGSVTLDRDMVWVDEFTYRGRDGSKTETIGGGAYVQSFPRLESGREITLESRNGQGAQTKATVAALKALESTGGEFALAISHNALTLAKTVRFRADVSSAVEFQMRAEMDGLQVSTAWYDGVIYLEVV